MLLDPADLAEKLRALAARLERGDYATAAQNAEQWKGAGFPASSGHVGVAISTSSVSRPTETAGVRECDRWLANRPADRAARVVKAAENLTVYAYRLGSAAEVVNACLDALRVVVPMEFDDEGCEIIASCGGWEPTHVKSSTVNGILAEPRRLGQWAWNFINDFGREPTGAEVRDHLDGKRIRRHAG